MELERRDYCPAFSSRITGMPMTRLVAGAVSHVPEVQGTRRIRRGP